MTSKIVFESKEMLSEHFSFFTHKLHRKFNLMRSSSIYILAHFRIHSFIFKCHFYINYLSCHIMSLIIYVPLAAYLDRSFCFSIFLFRSVSNAVYGQFI